MSGKATVTLTSDWLTPYEVTIEIDGRQPSTTRFAAGARAQTYVLEMAEKHELDLTYNVERPEGYAPRKVTPEMVAARIQRVCAKCRRSKPLAAFRTLTRVNQTSGRTVHFGWAEKCGDCEEES